MSPTSTNEEVQKNRKQTWDHHIKDRTILQFELSIHRLSMGNRKNRPPITFGTKYTTTAATYR
jgi:hypothetical protein